MEQDFLKFVAEIFEVDVAEISLDTTYGELPQWDSLMHLCLIDEITEKYEIEIPMERVSQLKTLRDFYYFVQKAQ